MSLSVLWSVINLRARRALQTQQHLQMEAFYTQDRTLNTRPAAENSGLTFMLKRTEPGHQNPIGEVSIYVHQCATKDP